MRPIAAVGIIDPSTVGVPPSGAVEVVVLLLCIAACWWWWNWRGLRSGPVVVAELWVYPIKSCAGVRMESALMLRGGLQWDREFAVIKPDGEVLTQKVYPKLAQICPSLQCSQRLEGDTAAAPAKPGPGAELTGISLSSSAAPPSPTVHVDLTDAGEAVPQTTVWGGNSEPLKAVRFPAADEWLSAHMGFACSLCRLTARRPLRTTRLAPVSNDPLDSCRYQDGSPLTVLSDASVAALNRKLRSSSHTSVKPQRFRPNIIISGCGAFDETKWTALSVGRDSVPIRCLMEAYRCTMVTIAQVAEADDAAGTRPTGLRMTKVMKSFLARPASTHGPLPRDNPNFAVFAAPELDESTLRQGDLVVPTGTLDGARSLYEHNARLSKYRWQLDELRFWHIEGEK
eukprot:COSAG01_NODE_14054_length_1502_cov_0.859587_1_plen_399_part_00